MNMCFAYGPYLEMTIFTNNRLYEIAVRHMTAFLQRGREKRAYLLNHAGNDGTKHPFGSRHQSICYSVASTAYKGMTDNLLQMGDS